MPRALDYTRYDPYKAPVFLDVVRHGSGELTRDDILRERAEILEYAERRPHYTCGWVYWDHSVLEKHGPEKAAEWRDFLIGQQAQMDEIHTWLSDHMTGPWAWAENTILNDSHHIAVCLHIERRSDRQLFANTWPGFFECQEQNHDDVEALAVLRGVIKPHMCPLLWLERNPGYDLARQNETSAHALRFDYPSMQGQFEQDCNGLYIRDPDDGAFILTDSEAVKKWLDENEAFEGQDRSESSFSIRPRYPEAHDRFAAQWGDKFDTVVDEGGRFVEFIGTLPEYPQRNVPQAFLDYLDGKCDFAVVPLASAPASTPAAASKITHPPCVP